MINVGANYWKLTTCPLGCPSLDTQEHWFKCQYINGDDDQHIYNYNDIFSDKPNKFMTITDRAKVLLQLREEKANVVQN